MPESRRATVLVTDAGRGSAISIIQSLGRAGYRVVAADADRKSLGFRSRYARVCLSYPDPEHDAVGFAAFVAEAVRKHSVNLIVPVTEMALRPLAAMRAELEPDARLAIPDASGLDVVTNKARTLELARSVGVPVPETRRVDTVQEALAQAEALGWPVVLKPQSSTKLWKQESGQNVEQFSVTYAASPEDLAQKMARFEGRCSVLLQRYCAGAGCGVELLMSHGRPLAAFQHKRLREIPTTGGASAYRESQGLDPQLYEWSVRLLSKLDWTGLAMVEFKIGERTELMEINGRVWGSLPLAIVSGMDFPVHMARLFLEGEQAFGPELLRSYKVGVRSRDLGRDLLWIGSVLKQKKRYSFLPLPERRRAFTALLGLLNPILKTDTFAWDDPLPGLLQVPRVLPKLWRKARDNRSVA